MSYEWCETLEKLVEGSGYQAVWKDLYGEAIPALNHAPMYPDHGFHHIKSVFVGIEVLLEAPELKSLNAEEAFCLLCAVYLHDVSMSVGLRKDHPDYSGQMAEARLKAAGLTEDDDALIEVIQNVIISHGKDAFKDFVDRVCEHDGTDTVDIHGGAGTATVRTALLMALLRMGDIMDWTRTRAPEFFLKEGQIAGISYHHWTIHHLISKIQVEHKGRHILLKAALPKMMGPYMQARLGETVQWMQRELNSNRPYLAEAGIYLERIEFSGRDMRQMQEALNARTKKREEPFTPFESYGEDTYGALFGREEMVQRVTNAIFGCIQVDDKGMRSYRIPILFGDSGVGKSSFLHSEISNIFKEYKFSNVRILSTYKDASAVKDALQVPDDNRGILVILDQFERSSPKVRAEIYQELVRQWDAAHNLYLLLSVTSDAKGRMELEIDKQGWAVESMILHSLEPPEVVPKILKAHGISYNSEVLEHIFLSLNQATEFEVRDMSYVHIVFKCLLDEGGGWLMESREDIKEHCAKLVDQYMDNVFQKADSREKRTLLDQACAPEGTGTIRVSANKLNIPDWDRLLGELEESKLIQRFDSGASYEFLHDMLAVYYFNKIMDRSQKSLYMLMHTIQREDTKDTDLLDSIHQKREELGQMEFQTSSLFRLVLDYLKTGNKAYHSDISFWLNYITNQDEFDQLISCCLEQFGAVRGEAIPQYFALRPHIVQALGRNPEKARRLLQEKRTQILDEMPQDGYLKACITGDLLKEGTARQSKYWGIPVIDKQVMKNTAINPILCEMYWYCKRREILPDLQNNGRISAEDLRVLCLLWKGWGAGQERFFYGFGHAATASQAESKERYEIFVRLILLFQQEKECRSLAALTIAPCQFQKGANPTVQVGGKVVRLSLEPPHLTEWLKFGLGSPSELSAVYHTADNILCLIRPRDARLSFFSRGDVNRVVWKCREVLLNREKNAGLLEQADLLARRLNQNFDFWEAEIRRDRASYEALFESCASCAEDRHLRHAQLKWLFGILLVLHQVDREDFQPGIQIGLYHEENELLQAQQLFDAFKLTINGGITLNPLGQYGDRSAAEECRMSLALGDTVPVRNVENLCPREISFCGNTSPILLISVGQENRSLAERFRDSVSCIVEWDERITEVSQAIDTWEYEIVKITEVLQENPHIKVILVLGDKRKCERTYQVLEELAKGGSDPKRYQSLSLLYDLETCIRVCRGLQMYNILGYAENSAVNTAELEEWFCQRFSQLQVPQSANLLPAIETDQHEWERLRNLAKTYIQDHGNHLEGIAHQMEHDDLNVLHRLSLAALICGGKSCLDSHGKQVLELEAVNLCSSGAEGGCRSIKFRSQAIGEYYHTQWEKTGGAVSDVLRGQSDGGQEQELAELLADNILRKRNTRKAAFDFCAASPSKQVPSLFSGFVLPHVDGTDCVLDFEFIWRSNECVYGLPLSLEACYQWAEKCFLPKLRELTKHKCHFRIGAYIYHCVNMHCYNNPLNLGIVEKLLSTKVEETPQPS